MSAKNRNTIRKVT